MIKYTNKDLKILKSWGMSPRPFKAVKDYSHLKSDLRWKNKEHLDAYDKYWIRRENGQKMLILKNIIKVRLNQLIRELGNI